MALIQQSAVRCQDSSLSYSTGYQSKPTIHNIITLSLSHFLTSNLQILMSELIALSILLSFTGVAHGYESVEEVKFKIPYELLADDRREEVREVVLTYTMSRYFKDIEFKTDESVIKFMMDHPVFLSATLKAMKIRNYLVKQSIDGMYVFNDHKGIIGKFEMIYSAGGKRYYFGFGGYYGLIFKLLGKSALFVEYRGVRGNPSRTYINANVYTRVDNIVLQVLLKILKPLIKPLMDKKIYTFIDETQNLAREINMHPEKVYQIVKESGHADKRELKEFRKMIL